MQLVLRDPFDYALPGMARIDVDATFDDYLNHLVPDETRSTIGCNDLCVAHGYIQWYFRVIFTYQNQK